MGSKLKRQLTGGIGHASVREEPPNGHNGALEAVLPAPSVGAVIEPAPLSVSASSEAARWLVWLREKVTTERIAVLVVLAAGALLFLPRLGTLGLWDPWETHYGEVAREMIVRDDYVYPYWESTYFFSKPALPLWMIALGLLAVGAENPYMPEAPLGAYTEWGVRLPFAFVAIFCLWAVYRIGRQVKDRATGLIAAFVLATSAQFIFIGKQAMADMPLVGFMTAGLAFFIAAVFDREPDRPASPTEKAIAGSAIALAVFSQLILIGREMKSSTEIVAIGAAGLLALGFILFIAIKGTRRDSLLVGFYICIGLAALAKGLAPLAVVGPTVILYMLFTLDFRILQRSGVIWGGVLFLLVAAPWYATLSLFNGRDEEGKTFIQRFWMHDNFGRVGQGVHGDRGGLAYFIEQLAYGMFPWIAVIPNAIGLAARSPEEEEDVSRRRALIFVLIWALWTYAFFSMSQTKFHHYIFPAVPAFAVLIGHWITHIAEAPDRRIGKFTALVIVLVMAVAARDLINEPQNLVNLFTYKYDRDYPRDVDPRPYIVAILTIGGLGMVYFFWRKQKDRVVLAFLVMAGLFGIWISHHHFNMLTPHWSQAHLFKTYFDERKGNEPLYAYQLNWRGETFYSRNRVQQVKEGGADARMKSLVDRPGREFIIMEQSRYHTLQSILSPDKRDKLHILDRSGNKFYLAVVDE